MAILDIGQSVPKLGPPKMMQIAPITVHQDSPNSTAEHTVMGLSSAKNAQSPGSVKRPQPPEAHTQNKKRNICDRNGFTDVSKDFGINSKEITLTRLASNNMSPRSHAMVEKAIRRSPSCEPSDPSRTHYISSEISITKVPHKDAANRDRRRDQEKHFSSPEKEAEKRDEPAQPSCSQEDRESEAARFWSKSSLGTCRISEAENYLLESKMEKDQGYEHCDMITREEENWDDASQGPAYLPYAEPPRLIGVLEENWDTYDSAGNNQVLIQDHSNYSPDSAYGSMGDSEMSHLVLGFPNPPGENRCWLNASLHSLFATLFSLPVADDMQQLLQMDKCSEITLMLGDLHKLWRKGGSEKTRIYNTIKKFKESLSSVERTYCSDRQQDVSEFLMALLNHLKTEFDKFLPKEKSNEEREDTPEKEQPSPKDERKSPSPITRNSPSRTFSDTSSSTVLEEPQSMEADSEKTAENSENPEGSENLESSESPESPENPIDKYFLQKIVEDYECKKCQKHREIPIENLMVYVDVPPENDVSSMDLIDAIQKTFAEEERNLICENCKHDTHKMKTFYKEFPKVMTIQINRYGMTNDGMMNKICTAVTIPEKLCLDEFLLDSADDKRVTKTYEPICIISHVGSNMDCGHYTSYVKHDDQWFHYNDMSVMPMTSREALSAAQSTAYLLFYVDSDLLDKPSLDCYSTRCSPVY